MGRDAHRGQQNLSQSEANEQQPWSVSMLRRVTAVDLVKETTSGKTKPAIVACATSDDEMVDVVAKFSAGCDEGVTALAREVIAACLGGNLGLPVVEPFLIEISPEWVDSVCDPHAKMRIARSSPVAFGSKLAGNQYAAWSNGSRLSEVMLPMAAAIFTFDAIIQNPDRRSDNPNCLVKGEQVRIIDHELAFTHGLILRWKPPWALGGMSDMETPGFHIFREQLRGKAIDFGLIHAAWNNLSDEQIRAYGAALPTEWSEAQDAVDRALQLIRDARDQIDGCIAEVTRVLG